VARSEDYSAAIAEYLNAVAHPPVPYGLTKQIADRRRLNANYLFRKIRESVGPIRNGNPIDYSTWNFCPRCRLLYPKADLRCAKCGHMLRTKPRTKRGRVARGAKRGNRLPGKREYCKGENTTNSRYY
jgi:hypothetical protein